MKVLNRKGFTLVELLAVIVVLALLMVLAMPAILQLVENAKRSAFQTSLKKIINAVETKYQSDSITSTQATCYKAETAYPGNNSYKGYVLISQDATTFGQVSQAFVYDESYASFIGTVGATKTQIFNKGYCDSASSAVSSELRCADTSTGYMPIVVTKTATVTIPTGCK